MPFLIDADFESILVPEDNGKQNRNESYTNKYQKHTKKDNDDFENSTKCCICIKGYNDSDVK